MKNYIQKGETLTFTATGPVQSGSGVIMGTLFGVAATSAETGATFEASIVGVFELPKADDNIAAGAAVYWDSAEAEVTTDAATGSNMLIGAATEAAGTAAPRVRVRLNGMAVA